MRNFAGFSAFSGERMQMMADFLKNYHFFVDMFGLYRILST